MVVPYAGLKEAGALAAKGRLSPVGQGENVHLIRLDFGKLRQLVFGGKDNIRSHKRGFKILRELLRDVQRAIGLKFVIRELRRSQRGLLVERVKELGTERELAV